MILEAEPPINFKETDGKAEPYRTVRRQSRWRRLNLHSHNESLQSCLNTH